MWPRRAKSGNFAKSDFGLVLLFLSTKLNEIYGIVMSLYIIHDEYETEKCIDARDSKGYN